jgi:hypothetical protein
MTREQLEARAWTLAQRLVSTDPQERCDAMDDLLAAADAYAAHTGGITQMRKIATLAETGAIAG